MRESGLWKLLNERLGKRPGNHLQRIESSTAAGIPDVEYCLGGLCGWIELKVLRDIPKRDETIVRVSHFTPEQRLWHRRRAACGGKSFVLIRIGDELGLIDGAKAAHSLGIDWTMGDVRSRALGWWPFGDVDWDDLEGMLS